MIARRTSRPPDRPAGRSTRLLPLQQHHTAHPPNSQVKKFHTAPIASSSNQLLRRLTTPYKSQFLIVTRPGYRQSFELHLRRAAITPFAPGNVQLVVERSQGRVDVGKTVAAEFKVFDDPQIRVKHHQPRVIRVTAHVPAPSCQSSDVGDQRVSSDDQGIRWEMPFQPIITAQFG